MTDGMKHLLVLAHEDATNQTALMSLLRVWQNYNCLGATTMDASDLSRVICLAEVQHPAESLIEILRRIAVENDK